MFLSAIKGIGGICNEGGYYNEKWSLSEPFRRAEINQEMNMESKTSRLSPIAHSTRRSFLKTAGVAGAALAGGLTTPLAFSSDELDVDSADGRCGFTALPPGFVYLNSGTEGSMPDCVLANYQNGLQIWAGNPTASYELDPVLGKRQELNRERAARFLGVGMNNICLTDNTTMGLSMTLMGLSFRPGDRVVTTSHEHNAIKSPLRVLQERYELRVETRSFPAAETLSGMDSSKLLDALFPNTPALKGAQALCVSHIYPTTGVRLPLRALRQKADELNIPYLVVDGAQAMGMVDLSGAGDSVKHSDFYACPGHKWLNGPPSTGVLYLRNADIRPPEFYPTISQRMGKYSGCNDDSGSCFPMAEALQVRGCSNAPGFAAMIRAMQFAEDAGGAARIEKHILGLSREVKQIILSRAPHAIVSPYSDAALLSGLTTFFPFHWDRPQTLFSDRKTADYVVRELLARKIQVRSIGFSNAGSSSQTSDKAYAIRVSTAYFNTGEQLERVRNALPEVLMHIV
jgi:selenocysteine lyase/cysteine desulfurase